MVHSLSFSKPRLLFCSALKAARVKKVAQQVGFLKEVVVFGDVAAYNHTPFSSFLQTTCPDVTARDEGNGGVAAIMCSIGATGLPKGFKLLDNHVLATIRILK